MTALDPGDFAHDDEQRELAGRTFDELDPDEVLVSRVSIDVGSAFDDESSSTAERAAELGDACAHPPSRRRLDDGTQVCLDCGSIIEGPTQAIIPSDRPGTDPTMRPGGPSSGGLRQITWNPEQQYASRPYSPEEVELEIVGTLDRIERGANYLTTKEEERAAAKLQYELAFARARFGSNGRSAEQRNDEAMLECRDLYSEWQLLELTCRTAREGMHNLRSKLSGLQSVLRSISAVVGSYR